MIIFTKFYTQFKYSTYEFKTKHKYNTVNKSLVHICHKWYRFDWSLAYRRIGSGLISATTHRSIIWFVPKTTFWILSMIYVYTDDIYIYIYSILRVCCRVVVEVAVFKLSVRWLNSKAQSACEVTYSTGFSVTIVILGKDKNLQSDGAIIIGINKTRILEVADWFRRSIGKIRKIKEVSKN